MKVNEITEAGEWYNLLKQSNAILKSTAADKKAKASYKYTMDLFQKDLEEVDPEGAQEFDELRKDYAARPSKSAADRLSSFILDRRKYVDDKKKAADALAAAQQASSAFDPAPLETPTNYDIPTYLRKQAQSSSSLAANPTPQPPTGPGIVTANRPAIRDNNGVIWAKDQTSGKWVNTSDNSEVTDVTSINALDRAFAAYSKQAELARQTQQMARTNRSA